MKFLRNFNFKNKKVLVRVDFNVPLDEKGLISDDFRIKKTLPTIEYLVKKGAKVILISHLGRPRGKDKKYSLKPVGLRLKKLLKQEVKFLPDYNPPTTLQGKNIKHYNPPTTRQIEKMEPGQIILLENLRFHKGEEGNEENFAKNLSKLADIFVNDAFAACHRAHASIVGIPKFLPSAAGLLLEKEIKVLSKVVEKPWRPLVVIIGGVKIATKIKVIEKFLEKANHLLLGGKIANSILAGKGVLVGRTFLEPKITQEIKKINLTSPKLHLPVDGVISLKKGEEGFLRKGAIGSVRKEEAVFDIGPETIKIFSEIIKSAKMILWSGPLGKYEEEKFEAGTKKIAKIIIRNYPAFKVAGGGDTISALNRFGLRDKFDHVSTGGGAMLEFLAGEKLPGLEALNLYGRD